MRRPASGRASIFTVDHFIMRQRQDEVFSVVVEHPEGQFIVMILTINRVELHVVQVSCIQPRFHLYQKPRPPISCGRETPWKSVDSSAIVTAPETCSPRIRLVLRKNSIASRFSRPPNSFGIHSPLYGCSRDKSLTLPHRRAAHQYQNVQSSKVRYRQGSY